MKHYKIIWKNGSTDIFRGESLSDIIIEKKLGASVIHEIKNFESFELSEEDADDHSINPPHGEGETLDQRSEGQNYSLREIDYGL
ncbi:MAG: hypothetical protein ABSB95_06410 [Dissulfurispiraceae bacterium]|jgi:hypothetical protein